jgi:hypothetical protein
LTQQAPSTRPCPYCKEEVRADAVRCRHCHAAIPPATQAHGGVCPFCREAIHPEATRCKHCLAALGPAGGCAGCPPADRATLRISRPRGDRLVVRKLARDQTVLPPSPEECGCPAAIMDGSEMWCLVACDEATCSYERCGYV